MRVKVPADKILPFLAKAALFKTCAKEVLAKVAPLLQGLECAEGSELVTAGKTNDGIGILFSGKAQVLLPAHGGELIPVEDVDAGDHFGEVGALLGKPSPYFVIASQSSRVLWLPSATVQSLVSNVPAIGEAISRRLTERVVTFAGVVRVTMEESHPTPIDEKYHEGGRKGWPLILSGMKTLLETGHPLPTFKME